MIIISIILVLVSTLYSDCFDEVVSTDWGYYPTFSPKGEEIVAAIDFGSTGSRATLRLHMLNGFKWTFSDMQYECKEDLDVEPITSCFTADGRNDEKCVEGILKSLVFGTMPICYEVNQGLSIQQCWLKDPTVNTVKFLEILPDGSSCVKLETLNLVIGMTGGVRGQKDKKKFEEQEDIIRNVLKSYPFSGLKSHYTRIISEKKEADFVSLSLIEKGLVGRKDEFISIEVGGQSLQTSIHFEKKQHLHGVAPTCVKLGNMEKGDFCQISKSIPELGAISAKKKLKEIYVYSKKRNPCFPTKIPVKAEIPSSSSFKSENNRMNGKKCKKAITKHFQSRIGAIHDVLANPDYTTKSVFLFSTFYYVLDGLGVFDEKVENETLQIRAGPDSVVYGVKASISDLDDALDRVCWTSRTWSDVHEKSKYSNIPSKYWIHIEDLCFKGAYLSTVLKTAHIPIDQSLNFMKPSIGWDIGMSVDYISRKCCNGSVSKDRKHIFGFSDQNTKFSGQYCTEGDIQRPLIGRTYFLKNHPGRVTERIDFFDGMVDKNGYPKYVGRAEYIRENRKHFWGKRQEWIGEFGEEFQPVGVGRMKTSECDYQLAEFESGFLKSFHRVCRRRYGSYEERGQYLILGNSTRKIKETGVWERRFYNVFEQKPEYKIKRYYNEGKIIKIEEVFATSDLIHGNSSRTCENVGEWLGKDMVNSPYMLYTCNNGSWSSAVDENRILTYSGGWDTKSGKRGTGRMVGKTQKKSSTSKKFLKDEKYDVRLLICGMWRDNFMEDGYVCKHTNFKKNERSETRVRILHEGEVEFEIWKGTESGEDGEPTTYTTMEMNDGYSTNVTLLKEALDTLYTCFVDLDCQDSYLEQGRSCKMC